MEIIKLDNCDIIINDYELEDLILILFSLYNNEEEYLRNLL